MDNIEKQEEKWYVMYKKLKVFQQQNGHCDVPLRSEGEQRKLAIWIRNQRRFKQRGELADDRVQALDIIQFVWNRYDKNWEEMFELFLKYKKKNGHTYIGKNATIDNVNIEKWAIRQSFLYMTGKIEEERERKLSDAGFVWDRNQMRWEEMYSLLITYKKQNGHCNVPYKYTVKKKKLGVWVSCQRFYRRENTLTQEREDRLNKIEFLWNPSKEKWYEMYKTLVEYKKENGHIQVPEEEIYKGKKLGIWVKHISNTKHKLGDKRKELLVSVGFCLNVREEKWNNKFELLKQYKEKYNHCCVPLRHLEEGQKLGQWVAMQRRLKKDGKASETRLEKLNNVGFIWEPRLIPKEKRCAYN